MPTFRAFSKRFFSRPKSIPSKTTKQLASFLRCETDLCKPGMLQQLCPERALRPYFDTIPCGCVLKRNSSGSLGNSQTSVIGLHGETGIDSGPLCSHSHPEAPAGSHPDNFAIQHLWCPDVVPEQAPQSFGLRRCAKVVRFVNFKWLSLIPSSLIGQGLLLIRGLRSRSLVPSTSLFGSGPDFLGPHLTPIGVSSMSVGQPNRTPEAGRKGRPPAGGSMPIAEDQGLDRAA